MTDKWYALYTRPRWEKKVADALNKKGLCAYCPMRTEVRQWSDRKKKISSPLFTSYVFVNLPEKERQRVFEIPGTVRYLSWLGKPAVIRQEEIDILKEWLHKEEAQEVIVTHLTPGDEITIPKGKLKNQKGVVKEVGKKRIKLILKELGLVVSIKLQDVEVNG